MIPGFERTVRSLWFTQICIYIYIIIYIYIHTYVWMDVSGNGGTPKIIHFKRSFHEISYQLLRIPHFKKPPIFSRSDPVDPTCRLWAFQLKQLRFQLPPAQTQFDAGLAMEGMESRPFSKKFERDPACWGKKSLYFTCFPSWRKKKSGEEARHWDQTWPNHVQNVKSCNTCSIIRHHPASSSIIQHHPAPLLT